MIGQLFPYYPIFYSSTFWPSSSIWIFIWTRVKVFSLPGMWNQWKGKSNGVNCGDSCNGNDFIEGDDLNDNQLKPPVWRHGRRQVKMAQQSLPNDVEFDSLLNSYNMIMFNQIPSPLPCVYARNSHFVTILAVW